MKAQSRPLVATPVIALSCALALCVAARAAQPQPDFSGRWVLDDLSQLSTDVAAVLTVRQVVARTTVHGAPMEPYFSELIVEKEVETGVRIATHKIGVVGGTVGGIAEGSKAPSPTRTLHSVTWQGERLAIVNGLYSDPPGERGTYSEHSEVWSLESRDRLVIVITDRRSDAAPVTRTLRYRRQTLR